MLTRCESKHVMALEAPTLLHKPTTPFSLSRRVAAVSLQLHRAPHSSFSITKTTRRIPTTTMAAKADAVTEPVSEVDSKPVRIVALVGKGSVSPLKGTPWEDVMLHTVNRLKWVDEGYKMLVFTDDICQSNDQNVVSFRMELEHVDILVIVAVTDQESVKWIRANSGNVGNIICFDSSPDLQNKLGGSYIHSESKGDIFGKIFDTAGSKKSSESMEVLQTVSQAWERHNSDDIRFCLLVIINGFIRPVPILQNLRSKGLSTLSCMVKNCGPQILNCLLDPNCRKALQCLNNCSPVDQVCNYRCIASYESPVLEAFSLCVLQKHNCLCLDAKVPDKPYVPPMVKFRGKDLCHETAEDLFVGWLGSLDWSWCVVAGQNPAYDQFPCQYQLFYRGKAKGSFWYEPVFQVKTLEGKMVWRRRKYRVKRNKVPGTFQFTVLDNGVVSNESWTIVDVADDLSWGLFYYCGAARVAGQSYTGAVLVSPDGAYPNDVHRSRLVSALENCGIKEWELFTVNNSSCANPPLGIPEGSRLHSVIEVEDQKSMSGLAESYTSTKVRLRRRVMAALIILYKVHMLIDDTAGAIFTFWLETPQSPTATYMLPVWVLQLAMNMDAREVFPSLLERRIIAALLVDQLLMAYSCMPL